MKKIINVCLTLLLIFGSFFTSNTKVAAGRIMVGVTYQSHVQNVGWQDWVVGGETSGTFGRSLRLEAMNINLEYAPEGASITYSTHVQNIGWQSWVIDGATAGTTGKSMRVEAIKIQLVNMLGYSVEYQVHIQNIGWQDWVKDGAIAGTTGQSLRLEGIRIRIVDHRSNLFAYSTTLSSVIEADYTTVTWAAYTAIVDANVVNVGNTQDQVDAATAAIAAGQANLIKIANMVDYDALLVDVTESNFTPVSWAAYQEVVALNIVTKQNTQKEVDDATNAIATAQKSLVLKLKVYNETLALVKEEDFTEESWTAYKSVVEANVVSNVNTQTEVDAATSKIADAQKLLVKVADINAYTAALAAKSATGYTTASWSAYQTVVVANVVTNQNTQAEVDTAVKAITDAQALLITEANMNAYTTALAAKTATGYTTASWSAYQTVVVANVVTNQNTQTEVDAAVKAITDAQALLIKEADLTEYIAALNAKNEVDYTDVTWTAYQAVVSENQVTNQDSQAKVNAAKEAILTAQKALIEVADMTDYDVALDAAIKVDYTPASWASYQAVIDANVRTNQDSQESVDASTLNIIAAQDLLVHKLKYYYEALAKVDEADFTPESWAIYQKFVTSNTLTTSNTQFYIDFITQKVIEAQELFLDGVPGDLTSYYNTLESVERTDYTDASWSAYQSALEKINVNSGNLQSEINKAEKDVIKAKELLIKVAVMTSYNSALNEEEESEYTTVTWEAYQAVISANVVTKQNSQVEVDTATANIVAAQADLIRLAVMTSYEAAKTAKTESEYTTASWATYQNVILANVVTNQSSQAEVNAATSAITSAANDLIRLAVMSSYEAAKTAMTQSEYTTASWETYQSVISSNVVTNQNSQAAVNAATSAITSAANNLVKLAVVSTYQTQIDAYSGSSGSYTTSSWAYYQYVLSQNIVTAQDSQARVDAAAAAIKAAQGLLVTPANMYYYDLARSKYSSTNYSTNSWATYQSVLTNNTATNQDPQSYVDARTSVITAGQANLVYKASYVATLINTQRLGPIFVGSNILAKARTIAGPSFSVSVAEADGVYINASGLGIDIGQGWIKFNITQISDSANTTTSNQLSIFVYE